MVHVSFFAASHIAHASRFKRCRPSLRLLPPGWTDTVALAEQLAWLAQQGQGFAAVHVNASAANLGLWANKKRAVAAAFDLSDFVVVLEDDVTLEQDGLRWFEWHVTSGLIFSHPNLALATCWSASFPYWPAAVEGRDVLAVRELGLLDKYWVRKGWGGGRLGLLGAAGTAGNRRGWRVEGEVGDCATGLTPGGSVPCKKPAAQGPFPCTGSPQTPSCAQAHLPLLPILLPCTPSCRPTTGRCRGGGPPGGAPGMRWAPTGRGRTPTLGRRWRRGAGWRASPWWRAATTLAAWALTGRAKWTGTSTSGH